MLGHLGLSHFTAIDDQVKRLRLFPAAFGWWLHRYKQLPRYISFVGMARKIPCMDDSLKGRQNTQPWRIATLDISRKQRRGVTEARPGKTMFGVDPVLGSRR